MMWYGNGMGGWGYPMMLVSNAVFWALIIIGGIVLIQYFARGDRTWGRGPTPEQLLAERFARGQIDDAEYRRRLDTLRGDPDLESDHEPAAVPGSPPSRVPPGA
jgi:putative membrane protein